MNPLQTEDSRLLADYILSSNSLIQPYVDIIAGVALYPTSDRQ